MIPVRLIRLMLPFAERDEVAAALEQEIRRRAARDGRWRAYRWIWSQVVRSIPSLLGRSLMRGRSGFDPEANAMNPGGPLVEQFVLEVRQAARRLRRRPGYSLLALVTLSLGVGGLAGVAAIAKPLLVDALPYPHPDQLARFWRPGDWRGREVAALRDEWTPDFTAVASFRPKDLTLERAGEPTRLLPGIAATADLFKVLGVAPALGRGFARGEDEPGAAPVAVLSEALWRELGASPRIVGSVVVLDGIPHTVAGVMPRGFWFPDPSITVWTNDTINATSGIGLYALVGRVGPGRRLEDMRPALDRVTGLLRQRFTYEPLWDITKNAELTSFRDWLLGPLRPSLYATMAGLAIILLIACANVSSLVLGQVEGRGPELALRLALGAGKRRLAAQILIEIVLLAIGAGVIGTGVAVVIFKIMRDSLPLGAWAARASLDWTVAALAIAVALAAALSVGVLPLMALRRRNLRGMLAASRTHGVHGRGVGLQGAVIVAEVALAVLLASLAGLLGRTVAKLYAIRLGITTEGVAVLDVALPTGVAPTDRLRMLRHATDELSTLSEVRTVGVTQMLPLRGRDFTMGLPLPGASEVAPTPFFRMVSRGYFAALAIPLRRGRVFDGSDRAGDSVKAIVINETLARLFFPGVDPLGRMLPRGGFGGAERIVGVVADAAEGTLTDRVAPTRYYLNEQVPFVPAGQTIVMRAAPGRETALLSEARGVLARVEPSMALQDATTMTRVLARAVGPARDVVTLLGALTLVALALGAVGIYGVLSQYVARQSRDWSIRIALGLAPRQVIGLTLARSALLIVPGMAAGVASAIVSARFLSSLLFGVAPTDAASLLAAAGVLALVGVSAGLVPAVRASRSDPALILREE